MRLRVVIRGAVQGVGFRPFVYRLATELGLSGWVKNSTQGVFVEVEGERAMLDQFLVRLQGERPPRSFIQSLEPTWLDAVGFEGFEIRESEAEGEKSALVLPDIATCPDCLRDVFDPVNRRYRYPFTNCTNCGPRFSIIEALPYDRPNTSMKAFAMCDECRAEYEDPANRRFHAQPNACPKCGPQLAWWNAAGEELASRDDALREAAQAIAAGAIVAVKGLGGFHLMCLASDDAAVARLRERKHREEKPFAVMFPSIVGVREECEVSPLEARLLESAESPIVLLRGKCGHGTAVTEMSGLVAPGNPWLGVMLPYTPLHSLLLREIGIPVVATSGNLSDEPICTDEHEAVERLASIADFFLVHNRPIARHVDDSIVRVMVEREMVLRRARGYAPLPIPVKAEGRRQKAERVLAVGAHLKNTVALSIGPQVFVSHHIGDLETEQSNNAFRRVIADFQRLYEVRPETIVSDMHPDYLSTKYAREKVAQASSLPVHRSPGQGEASRGQTGSLRYVEVQHHVAHVLSCMAENEVEPPVLGISWDGTGFGLDGTVWGGELLQIARRGDGMAWQRVAHLRQFRLPGGETAVKEPRRSALGLLHAAFGDACFDKPELAAVSSFRRGELSALRSMLNRELNSPLTSSVGRLFDAVAALVELRQVTRFEGQAAMELEFAAEGVEMEEAYALRVTDCGLRIEGSGDGVRPRFVLDWLPMLEAVLADVKQGVALGVISARFHNALAEAIVAVAKRVDIERAVLSGGCFQNRRLLERTVARLTREGFRPYWHQRVPTNDGGIALGQVASVRWTVSSEMSSIIA